MVVFRTFVGAIETEILLSTGQDLTDIEKIEIHVIRPDDTTEDWTATTAAADDKGNPVTPQDGWIRYLTDENDLLPAGRYILQAYLEWGSGGPGHFGELEVLYVYETGAGASTYTGSPSTRPIDAVRLELGRSESLDLINDDEIAYNLVRASNNAILAASFCAESIAGYYAGMVDKSMGNSSVSLSQKAEAWRKKSEALRAQALNSSLTPRATSSSSSRPLKFWIGQHDNRGHYPGTI